MSSTKPGPAPEGDQDQSAGLLTTTVLLSGLTFIILSARFWVRIRIVKNFGLDDWAILFAGLGHPIGCGLVIAQVHYGFGRHRYYLSEYDYKEFLKYSYGEWMQTFATLMFTKVSICLFLLRIVIHKSFVRPLQAGVVILVTSNVILTILWIAQCKPLIRAWNTAVPGTCFTDTQLQNIILAQAIISAISDFTLAACPILILRTVQINMRTKVGLCCLMGLGVITGSLCIVRTVLNWQTVSNDNTWISIPCWYWRAYEVFIGVVCATIPTLRPGYNLLEDKMNGVYNSWKNNSYSRKRSYQTFGDTAAILAPRAAHTQVQATEANVPLGELGILKTTTVEVDPELAQRPTDCSYPSLRFDRN